MALAMIGTEAAAQCQAGFTHAVSGLTVQFTNQASGSYNYIEYYFGDGNSSQYVANPVHTYADSGIYEVCQFIMDTVTFNCFDYKCDTLYLGNVTCQAAFYPFINGLNVEVYNESLGMYDSLWFDFGDGYGTDSSIASHTYSSPGTYTICLSLFDSAGMCDSVCYQIPVDSNSCEADFSYSANGLTVSFTDQSIGNYNAVFWDFGDGIGNSESPNPTYTYVLPGTYEVCLFVYDSVWFGCQSEYCETITVTAGGAVCKAGYKYEAEELQVKFTNYSTGSIALNTWDFGDGSAPSFDANPTHKYAAAGTYTVCLTVANAIPFCVDQYCEDITVHEFTCEPSFTWSFNQQNGYTFVNTTTVGNFNSVLWEFGDGNTSTFPNPTYYYNVPGTYKVCLSTFDNDNLCGITCEEVGVYPLGVASPGQLAGVRVAPNPMSGTAEIIFPDHDDWDVHICDMSGREVFTASALQSASLRFSFSMAEGVYVMKIFSRGQGIAYYEKIRVIR
ncbi:MAG: hypothetical protein Kow0075_13640 [Salibacteraceae bacterium]